MRTYVRPWVSYSAALERTVAGFGRGQRLACHVFVFVRTHPLSTMCVEYITLLNTYAIMTDIPIIVIPYRNRHSHLMQWLTRVRHRLPQRTVIIVVEQQDDYKFNRGALLNAGFVRAEQLGASRVIFHDVDLVPDDNLVNMYVDWWPNAVVHFGARFSRYNNSNSYFGGVVGFDIRYFPGFSNKFYGWGGEDDSLYRRTDSRLICRPQIGNYDDLENYGTPRQKLQSLRNEHKCSNKRELLKVDNCKHDNHRTLQCHTSYSRKYNCEWLNVTLPKSSRCRTAARVMPRIKRRRLCAAERCDQ